jgi:hypothetical protein
MTTFAMQASPPKHQIDNHGIDDGDLQAAFAGSRRRLPIFIQPLKRGQMKKRLPTIPRKSN